MTIETFIHMSIAEISRKTEMSPAQWSRYFRKKSTLNEKTLEQAGSKLGITSDEVLKAVNERRKLLTN
jgi:transcriptional regulator with XRE-family HTH domain